MGPSGSSSHVPSTWPYLLTCPFRVALPPPSLGFFICQWGQWPLDEVTPVQGLAYHPRLGAAVIVHRSRHSCSIKQNIHAWMLCWKSNCQVGSALCEQGERSSAVCMFACAGRSPRSRGLVQGGQRQVRYNWSFYSRSCGRHTLLWRVPLFCFCTTQRTFQRQKTAPWKAWGAAERDEGSPHEAVMARTRGRLHVAPGVRHAGRLVQER